VDDLGRIANLFVETSFKKIGVDIEVMFRLCKLFYIKYGQFGTALLDAWRRHWPAVFLSANDEDVCF